MSIKKSLLTAIRYIEIGAAWCIWMLLLLPGPWILFWVLTGYIPGLKGGYRIVRCMRLQKTLDAVPYEKLISLARNKKGSDNFELSDIKKSGQEEISIDDIISYVFVMNKKIHQGIRAILACILLGVAIFAGLDWTILHTLIRVLFVLGLLKLAQGSMEIL